MADILLNNAAKIYSDFIYEFLSLRLLRSYNRLGLGWTKELEDNAT